MYSEIFGSNIIAENRECLIRDLMSFLLEHDSPNLMYEYIFEIHRDECGCHVGFKTFDDIPHKNIICKHGNKMLIYSQLN